MKKSTMFFLAVLFYAVIDVVWNVALALPLYEVIHAANGTDRSFAKLPSEWGVLGFVSLLIFFLLIGYANMRLVIAPAVAERSVKKAVKNGFILGCAAYATYIVPVYLLVSGWPAILVPIDILIGGGLSVATSSIVTAIALRRTR